MSDLRDRRDPRGGSPEGDLPGGPERSVRVLILDEDRVEGGMVAFHLRREGLVVMLMTSIEEATDAITWSAPDVVLVEVTGRGFDGHAFLATLAQLPVDVFAVADRPLEVEDELEALRLGVMDVLMKPLDPVALTRRLVTRPVRERRGAPLDLPDGGISGDLVVHSVTHLLQMAHRHRMNARLHFEIDGDWGVLLVRHGEIIDAEAPSATGREAAYQALRVERGAFVLFPLGPDAEELSRDDVVRADLASLVSEALGRQEPRAVNPVREQQRETFVLPNVDSPRAPVARGNEETLEYTALTPERAKPTSARVKRPGERAREERAQNTDAPRQAVSRHPSGDGPGGKQSTRPPLVSKAAVAQDVTEARTVVPVEAMRRALEAQRLPLEDHSGRVPSAAAATDNGAVRGRFKDGDAAERRSGTDPMGRLLHVSEGGEDVRATVTDQRVNFGDRKKSGDTIIQTPRSAKLKRVGGPRTGESARPSRKPTDPELAKVQAPQPEARPAPQPAPAPVEVPRAERLAPARPARLARSTSPLTWVLVAVLVGLGAFVAYRLATREAVAPPVEDAEVKLGRALLDLDGGRKDQARIALAALVVSPEAPSGALSTLARLHYEDGRLAEAEALLERLAQRHPRDPEVLGWLGLVQLERDNVTRARETLERAKKAASPGALLRQLESLLGPSGTQAPPGVPSPPGTPAPAPGTNGQPGDAPPGAVQRPGP